MHVPSASLNAPPTGNQAPSFPIEDMPVLKDPLPNKSSLLIFLSGPSDPTCGLPSPARGGYGGGSGGRGGYGGGGGGGRRY